MTFTRKIFKSPGIIDWNWPLTIGLMRGDAGVRKKLHKRHWPKEFTSIEPILSSSDVTWNMVFIPGGARKAIKTLDNVTWKAGVLLIQDITRNVRGMDAQLVNGLRRVARRVEASVVVVFSATDLDEWFNSFIVELSHKKDVVTAVQSSGENAFVLYDPRFKKEAPLEIILDKLIDRLRKVKTTKVRLKNSLDGKKEFTGPELAKYLSQARKQMYFLYESSDASTLKEIGDAILLPSVVHKKGRVMKRAMKTGSDFLTTDRPKYSNIDYRKMIDERPRQPIKETESSEGEEARYLQAKFQKEGARVEALEKNTDYSLAVFIGKRDETFLAGGPIADNEIFKDEESQEETLQIVFHHNHSEVPELRELLLPKKGNSPVAHFDLKTTDKHPGFTGRLFAYHRNRLIQQIEISGLLWDGLEALSVHHNLSAKVVFCVRKNLVDLSSRTNFDTSLVIENGPGDSSVVTGFSKGSPIQINYSKGLQNTIDILRKIVEDTAINVDDYPEDIYDPANRGLFWKLAAHGSQLYKQLVPKGSSISGPLQIVTAKPEFIPLDFFYELRTPEPNATLCDNARESLRHGKCGECFDKTESPAPHICPFGFLGLSRIIERHSYKPGVDSKSDFSILFEPAGKRRELNIMKTVLYGCTRKLGEAGFDIKAELPKVIKKAQYAENWDRWTQLIKQLKPDCLVLLVHVEKNDTGFDQLEINGNFLMQLYLEEKYLTADKTSAPPIVFVIGCETAKLKDYGFDISSQLLHAGIPIVLSSITKIRGRHAGPMVIKLLEFLKKNEHGTFTFGEVVLKLKQYLVSQGIMTTFALLAQGDADWQLKT